MCSLPPDELLVPRTRNAAWTVTEHTDLFDVVVLRPTSVYGYSSNYVLLFEDAKKAAEKGLLKIALPKATIMHATHVDDCAEAYVALAEHADRAQVAGQCYNISGRRFETFEEVADALVLDYGTKGGVELPTSWSRTVPRR